MKKMIRWIAFAVALACLSLPLCGMANAFYDPDFRIWVEWTDSNGNLQSCEQNPAKPLTDDPGETRYWLTLPWDADLNGLTLLKDLNLAGSPGVKLDGLSDLPSLTAIHLEHTGVRDLSPLETLPALKTVTVSRDMLPLRWSPDARFAVILIR